MWSPVIIGLGKVVQALAGLRGGGSALPGLLVEKLNPRFASKVLGKLPRGVVLVSGTNGKTTTVKIVAELLEAAGLRVFTNNTGSNFMRGVISSLLRKVSLGGHLDADIAVLELDEAHAVNFVEAIKPRYALLLNVMRDQLDRFGEIDYTAKLLAIIARNTTELVVLNHEDSRLAAIPEQEQLAAEIRWFGLAPALRAVFPEDNAYYEEELAHRNTPGTTCAEVSGAASHELASIQACAQDDTAPLPPGFVQLAEFTHQTACVQIDGISYEVKLALRGIYNALNATAALALVHAIVPDVEPKTLLDALAGVQSAFGRGEVLDLEGQPVELVLVKNPGGFRLALMSYDHDEGACMIAINDEYADGRDMSWLYDVSFEPLRTRGVSVLSGMRAYDMALRLAYDEVTIGTVVRDLRLALDTLLRENPSKPLRIYCTYTAMITLRKQLASLTTVEKVK